MRNLLKEYTKD